MSTLRVNTLQDATGSNQPAMVGAAKAWVNFNGTGTVSIREQFNVSSITDNGTGDYTVNFTTAMSDGNYSVSFSCTPDVIIDAGGASRTWAVSTTASGSVRVLNYYQEVGYSGYLDYPSNFVTVFR